MNKYTVQKKCSVKDCDEVIFYGCSTKKQQKELYAKRWKCIRHTKPDEVLSKSSNKKTIEYVCIKTKHGNYWHSKNKSIDSGFTYGPGFVAWAGDFKPGTILKITAEINFNEIKT